MTKRDCVDQLQNRDHQKGNGPNTLVLKWGNHKHRIIINAVDRGLPASEPEKEAPSTAAAACSLPWNLRAKNRTVGPKKKKIEEAEKVAAENKNLRLKAAKKEPMSKLAVALSKSEIMEDFLKMSGKKPPSRPTKRPAALQRDLNNIYPGLNFKSISSDRYHVHEPPPCTKKVKGLKGLMMEEE